MWPGLSSIPEFDFLFRQTHREVGAQSYRSHGLVAHETAGLQYMVRELSVVSSWHGNKVIRRGAIIALTTLLLQACGGGGGSDPATGGSTPPPAGQTPTPPPAQGNRAPTISGTPSTAVQTGVAYTFTPQASDPDGNTLTYSITNRPAWATFNQSTGTLSGTPSAAGAFAGVVISVSDGQGGTASLPGFSIQVSATAPPPAVSGSARLSWTPPTTRTDGSALSNLAGYRIHYGTNPSDYSNTVSVNTAGVTNYLIENLSRGTYYFVISAVDSTGAESAYSSAVTKTIG
jgi:hypothetical protein